MDYNWSWLYFSISATADTLNAFKLVWNLSLLWHQRKPLKWNTRPKSSKWLESRQTNCPKLHMNFVWSKSRHSYLVTFQFSDDGLLNLDLPIFFRITWYLKTSNNNCQITLQYWPRDLASQNRIQTYFTQLLFGDCSYLSWSFRWFWKKWVDLLLICVKVFYDLGFWQPYFFFQIGIRVEWIPGNFHSRDSTTIFYLNSHVRSLRSLREAASRRRAISACFYKRLASLALQKVAKFLLGKDT